MTTPTTTTTTTMGHACFFYGTLMSFKVLSRVLYGTPTPEAWQSQGLHIRPAILHDYCRHQVRFADYPGIVAEPGKCVRGTYVTGITDMELWRLDAFEGGEYRREVVRVRLLRGEGEEGMEEMGERECATYVYKDENRLVKEEWDFAEFVREKLHRWVGDEKEYSGQSTSGSDSGDEEEDGDEDGDE
ncbi:AIG2-like family-domain-containing protein [Tricharina praecox]|uniref:AIG2-like family-domain-containing protein n=1 Tax=Tricharina praecox TaxID=43433 RepID=UPI00221F8552|nr:AIG2-like family-domain-containing protein [Tricharina praecox]KAI5854305.1 AIG2-like family-domain-containing protein [Tricharina praecox]